MPSKTQLRDERLIESFVAAFDKLDQLVVSGPEIDPIAWALTVDRADSFGHQIWRPVRVNTSAAMLDPIYADLHARFPPLYERLVLNYRWAQVDLKRFMLLANPPGPDLDPLHAQISNDPIIYKALREGGYIRFGKGPSGDYDPVCFDTKSRSGNRDFKIVKIAHEEILCNNRVKIVSEIAPSFYSLVVRTIDLANQITGIRNPT